jgi:hypothetical protein
VLEQDSDLCLASTIFAKSELRTIFKYGRQAMPYTVPYSFNEYRSKMVDLDPEQVKIARKSRDYLKAQLEAIAKKAQNFPALYGGTVDFGSFARKTKVRELDDIDFLLLISTGKGSQSIPVGFSFNRYNITVPDHSCSTWMYTNDDNTTLNSRKVLAKIRDSLDDVPNYQKADIKYTGEAVVLKLKSYPWSFDIVPAVPVSDGSGEILHYLIPDGNGIWKRTDPRRDKTSITKANKYHNGNLIPVIRIIKYWNAWYYDVPKISSYFLETLLIKGFELYQPLTSIRGSIEAAFHILQNRIFEVCPDPKGLEGNLDDHETYDTKLKVSRVASTMANWATNAMSAEQRGDNKTAIEWWGKVLPGFPPYGG